MFLQEPALSRKGRGRSYRLPCSLPSTGNKFYATPTPQSSPIRALIVADEYETMDLMPQYSTPDIATVLWTLRGPSSSRHRSHRPQNRHHDISSNSDSDDDLSQPVISPADIDKIVLCSFYWDKNYLNERCNVAIPSTISRLIHYCNNNHLPLLLCGDSNAHSEAWGHPTQDNRGKLLEDLIVDYGLTIHNSNSYPTWESRHLQSYIDVTLSGGSIGHFITKWRVDPTATVSDHNLIEFQITCEPPPVPNVRNLRKVNWKYFSAVLYKLDNNPRHRLPQLWSPEVIEGQVSLLYHYIEEGLNASECWPKPKKIKQREKHLSTAYRVVKQECNRIARKKGTPYWTPELHARYRKARRDKRREYRKSQRGCWKFFTSQPDHPLKAAELMRIIRHNGNIPPTLLAQNGHYTTSKLDTIQVLMDTHFPDSVSTTSTDNMDFVSDDPVPLQILDWITLSRVNEAIGTFSNFKAGGTDEVKPIILKWLPYNVIERLTAIYTACIQFRYTPLKWRESRTVFIPKPGREDYSIAKAYRPISLTSFFLKTLERLCLWHMEQSSLITHPFHDRQHAFRKGHSTDAALSQVVSDIEQAIFNKRHCLTVFIDIEGAFDNLDTTAAIGAMNRHRVPTDIAEWYSSYLRNRKSTVSYGSENHERLITKGTPQGGVLSPLLWNFAFDDLLELYDNLKVNICGFADDACLTISGGCITTMRQRMQYALTLANDWATSNGLKLSTKKTIAMLFSRHRDSSRSRHSSKT